MPQTYLIRELVSSLSEQGDSSVKLLGDTADHEEVKISGVSDLNHATIGDISFIRDKKNLISWVDSDASAAIIASDLALNDLDLNARPLIQVKDADLGVALVLGLFQPPQIRPQGIAASAVIDQSSKLDPTVVVGEGCFIGPEVHIDAQTVLHPNVTITGRVTIGKNCEIHPGSVIREDVHLGDRVILQANATIGTDGFNYRPSEQGLTKIPHIGGVEIHQDVEIGSGTCVDRGKFGNTVIGQGTKIDNLCQIGHNCEIGRFCVIAGHCGISGSCKIGDQVMLGGAVGLKDHLSIGDGVRIAASSGVMHNIPAGEIWAGTPAKDLKTTMKELASLKRLPELMKLAKQFMPQA